MSNRIFIDSIKFAAIATNDSIVTLDEFGCERERPWKNPRKISFAEFETGTF
jgi:hypothetical protein